ncbi:MAG: GTP-binding protein, partial [Rectinemataceae bacterium]|nr:GTP-binding protein [Rectinemataceae bacterium]
AEMALFVVDAVSGPQVQTERLWELAGEMGIARAVFINRMDKEHADFDAAMAALEAACLGVGNDVHKEFAFRECRRMLKYGFYAIGQIFWAHIR